MKKIFIYYTLLLCIAFSACTEDEIEKFGEIDYVYFNIEDPNNELTDENGYLNQKYTFALEADQSITEKNVGFPLTLVGTSKTNDRSVSVILIDSLTTAEEGVHFELLPESESVIPAGKGDGEFFIKIKKTEDLDTERYNIALNIVDNDMLMAGPKRKLIISISNQFERPDWWRGWSGSAGYIGDFTVTKCRLWMIFHDLLDGTDPLDREPYKRWISKYEPWAPNGHWEDVDAKRNEAVSLFALWLAKGDENGDPYIDENGQEVLSTF